MHTCAYNKLMLNALMLRGNKMIPLEFTEIAFLLEARIYEYENTSPLACYLILYLTLLSLNPCLPFFLFPSLSSSPSSLFAMVSLSLLEFMEG